MTVTLASILNVHDLRDAARRRLPKGVFEYVDRGSEDEIALAANRAAFEAVKLKHRVMLDVSKRDTSIELFDRRYPIHVAIAPTGSAALRWYGGELQLGRAARAAGVPFALIRAGSPW